MSRSSPRSLFIVAGAVLLACGLVLGGHARATLADDTTVSINGFAFNPDPITISTGDTITWSNDQSVPHTVTADDGSFDLGVLSPSDTASLTFAGSGTYPYHCNIHPSMHGTITVVDPGGA